MRSLLGIEFKLSDDFWNVLKDLVAVYFMLWLLLLPFILIITGTMTLKPNSPNPMSGFSLFQYFPFWVRFVLFNYIVDGILAFPFIIIIWIAFSRHQIRAS